MSAPFVVLFAAGSGHELGIPWGTLATILVLVGLLMLAIRSLGLLAASALERRESRAAEAASLPSTVVPSAIANVERRVVVIIAAAVAATAGHRARVLDIRRVQGGNISSQQAWSMEGRREIYLSHRIR